MLSDTKSIRKLIWNVVLFPIRVLFLPFQLIGLFHSPELKVTEEHYRPPLGFRIWNAVNRIVQAPFIGLASFFWQHLAPRASNEDQRLAVAYASAWNDRLFRICLWFKIFAIRCD